MSPTGFHTAAKPRQRRIRLIKSRAALRADTPIPGGQTAHLYRDIFENCAWGVFQTTDDGRYLTANPALARIYGYASPAELLGRLTDIGGQLYVDPARRAAFVQAMMESGVVHGFESQVYRRDGSVIWITETCREVRTTTGRFLYYEGTVEDISERKRAEAALRRATAEAEAAKRAVEAANLELERRVAERTAELRATQDELLLQGASLDPGQAHRDGRARAAQSAERDPQLDARACAARRGRAATALERPLTRIDRCVARCERIIADLIDYSHVRKLDAAPRAARRLAARVPRRLPPADGITLELRLDAPGGAGPSRWRALHAGSLVNLVDNAVQAMERAPAARRPRRASPSRTARRRRTSCSSSSDSGPGIPPRRAAQGVRAAVQHQELRHRPGPADREADRRAAWRHDRAHQPARRGNAGGDPAARRLARPSDPGPELGSFCKIASSARPVAYRGLSIHAVR